MRVAAVLTLFMMGLVLSPEAKALGRRRPPAQPTVVQAMDSMEWLDHFGIASGLNKTNLEWLRRGKFLHLRSESNLSRDLIQLVDVDGVRLTLMPPNLPIRAGEAARPLFEKWKIDTRNWLLQPASRFSPGDKRVLADFLHAVEGLNERDRVTCEGMITGVWPCAGWEGNFIDSAVYLHEVVRALAPGVPIVGPGLVTPWGGSSVGRALVQRRYLNSHLGLTNLSGLVDFGNFHSYGGISEIEENLGRNAVTVFPRRPIQITEWGIFSYDVSRRPWGAAWANQILDVWARTIELGITRIYLYGLVEKTGSPVNSLIVTFPPTPRIMVSGAYWVLGNLHRELRQEKSSGYSPGVLSYAITSSGHRSRLLQRGVPDEFQILVWGASLEAPQLTLPRGNYQVSSIALEEEFAESEQILPEADGDLLRFRSTVRSEAYPVLFNVRQL